MGDVAFAFAFAFALASELVIFAMGVVVIGHLFICLVREGNLNYRPQFTRLY